MQNITFKDSQRISDILNNPAIGKTTLTELLANSQREPDGRDLCYIDYLTSYRWDCLAKAWLRRIRVTTPSIGRLAYIQPTCGEPFYLRLLLGHQKGCRSFEEIRTISGVLYPTYRAACEKLCLIGDDREWTIAFTEASAWATSAELRALFAHMLLFCEVWSPLTLWEQQWKIMSDDINRHLNQLAGSSETHVSTVLLQQHVLYEIEVLLNSSASPHSLANFGLPMPNASMVSSLRNRLLMEERCYDIDAMIAQNTTMRSTLNNEQQVAYNMVISFVTNNEQLLLFVYGHGGTGKTYLWTAIITALRSTGKIVLAVAAPRIASLLLPSGRTAYSRFKIPLDLTDDSLCHIKKNTQLSELLMETSLIIWDEAPTSDRRCFESLDKSLRDIIGNTDVSFGGKSILLGGDFRQTLPVKPRFSKAEIISSSLPKSYLWKSFKILKLNENMRLSRSQIPVTEQAALTAFSKWLLDTGDGKIGDTEKDSNSDVKFIEIPSNFAIQPDSGSLSQLINFVYDETMLNFPTSNVISERAIVCPKK